MFLAIFVAPKCSEINKMKERIKTVVVYCASSSKIDKSYINEARELGKLLAVNNITCITGAGFQGLMGAVNDSVLEHGGRVKGIIPKFMVDSGWCHPQLTELVVTESIHQRKNLMAQHSDAAIALPGGLGTLEELAEILTWKQLGLYKKPVIILNTNGYYNQFLKFLDTIISENFMNAAYKEMWQVASSTTEIFEAIRKNSEAFHAIPKYDKKEL